VKASILQLRCEFYLGNDHPAILPIPLPFFAAS
jgi:hypothetical protein